MQQRIDRLESLVKTLIIQNQGLSDSQSPPPLDGNVEISNNVMAGLPIMTAEATSIDSGTTLINGGQSVYKPANDWSTVMQEVRSCSWNLLL